MGFFSKKTSTTLPATGFYAQPAEYQNYYNNILNAANKEVFFPGGKLNTAMFTPLAETADETEAFNRMRAGFTPTPETLGKDIAMLTNPFDQYVVDDINRQAQGAYSTVKQQAQNAGQYGSNRNMLAASDVDQQRLNNIGQFRQSQYNTALNQVLGSLTGLRQNDAENLLGIGEFQRELDYQTNTAPYTALTAAQGVFNAIPTEFGNFGQKERTITQKSGTLGGSIFKSLAPIVGTAVGGPVGGAIGGAVGGSVGGGGLAGGLQGGISSIFTGGFGGGAGAGASSGMSGIFGGFDLGQALGSLGSSSPTGPYQPISASFFR